MLSKDDRHLLSFERFTHEALREAVKDLVGQLLEIVGDKLKVLAIVIGVLVTLFVIAVVALGLSASSQISDLEDVQTGMQATIDAQATMIFEQSAEIVESAGNVATLELVVSGLVEDSANMQMSLDTLLATPTPTAVPVSYTLVFTGGLVTANGGSYRLAAAISESQAGDFQSLAEAHTFMYSVLASLKESCGTTTDSGYSNTGFFVENNGSQPIQAGCEAMFKEFGFHTSYSLHHSAFAELISGTYNINEAFLVIDVNGQVLGRVSADNLVLQDQPCWFAALKSVGYVDGNAYNFYPILPSIESPEGTWNRHVLYSSGFYSVHWRDIPDFCGDLGLEPLEDTSTFDFLAEREVFMGGDASTGYIFTFGEIPMDMFNVTVHELVAGKVITVQMRWNGQNPVEYVWEIIPGTMIQLMYGENSPVLLTWDNELGLLVLESTNYVDTHLTGNPVLRFAPQQDTVAPYFWVEEAQPYYRMDLQMVVYQQGPVAVASSTHTVP